MTQVDDIRKSYFFEGLSISDISRKSGVDRKTVRKYLSKEDWNPVPATETSSEKYPKLQRFKAIIKQWLENDRQVRRK